MTGKPILVFVTYYRLVPTGQIGIFKRCIRLMSGLLDDFDIHLVNFGPLPEQDALFAAIRPRITVYDPPEDDLGDWLEALFRRLQPAGAVIGESPLRGSLRLAHRVASHVGVWQVAMDNYYGPLYAERLPIEWPKIDRWLLLGLPETGAPTERRDGTEIIPPLVRFPVAATTRDHVCVIGYDKQTLLSGARFAERVLPRFPVDFLIAPRWRPFFERQGLDLDDPRIQVHELPSDQVIYDTMSRARLVFGKAGYQQVVEGLALGAPIVCQAAGGGLEAHLVAGHLRPWVRFLAADGDLDALLAEIEPWLRTPVETPGQVVQQAIPDPIAFGASRLGALVDERAA